MVEKRVLFVCVSWDTSDIKIIQFDCQVLNRAAARANIGFIKTLYSLVPTHLILSFSIQHLEARQPHARLRVHVDVHAVTGPEPQKLLHPAHLAAEAAGLPSITASTHRKNGPHLALCVTLQAHTPRQISPTPAASSVSKRKVWTLCVVSCRAVFL